MHRAPSRRVQAPKAAVQCVRRGPTPPARCRRWVSLVGLAAVAMVGPRWVAAACLTPPGDLTANGVTTVVDVMCTIQGNLWSLAGEVGPPPACLHVPGSPALLFDHNCDGIINVTDILITVSYALGVPLDTAVDANGDQCVDACESDLDGDGDFDVTDCAPAQPTIHHGATETCNGFDDDCDGVIDGPAGLVDLSCSDGNACNGVEHCTGAPVTAGIVIDEVYLGAGAAPVSWFEVVNTTHAPIDLRGWTVEVGGTGAVIDPGGALFAPAGGYLVVALGSAPPAMPPALVSVTVPGLTLGPLPSSLRLLDATGTEIDRIDIDASFPLGAGVASMELADVDLDNGAASSWVTSSGVTPGYSPHATPKGPRAGAAPTCAPGVPLTCNDGNPCTVDVCDPAVGCTTLGASGPCDDGIACTADTCDPATGCLHTPDSALCDDAISCTADVCLPADAAADGQGCVHDTGLAFGTQCDDGNPCTFPDVCDFSGNCHPGFANPCDDADPCTLDTCDSATGACSHVPNPCDDGIACTTDACDPATGCVHTPDDTACDDAVPCTADVCLPADAAADGQGCVHDTGLAFGTQCDDNNPCTFTDVCDFSGNCHPGFANTCDDADPCTLDTCNPATGACTHAPNPCDDGIDCTTDACDPAAGCVHTPDDTACDDAVPCTADVCLPADAAADGQGCVHDTGLAFGTQCDDGNPCTFPDVCDFSGNCHPGFANTCDDANPCTLDTCNPATGVCGHAPNPCDDGIACTTDACDPAAGCVHTPDDAACDDAMPCTTDLCSPTDPAANPNGCVHDTTLAFGTQCDDNNPCTFPDVCDFSGNCHPGFANTCDDADPCTLDTCDSTTGACSHAPNPCDDGLACTTDACDPATGCVHTPDDTACNDAMPCTADLCSPADPAANPNGCVHDTTLAFGTQCDDGNPCTFPDVCDFSGNCHPGFANTCDDANPCTLDTCDSATGACSHAPNPCDDGIACTTDSCDPATGCAHTPDDTACDDAVPCTADICLPTDVAADGQGCVHDPVLAFGTQCDDNNPCTFPDVCDFSGNCHPGFANTCDDADPCTLDTCDSATGACSHAPNPCDDGIACTTDSCDPATGCVHTPDDTACDDAMPCTADLCSPTDPAANPNGCVHDTTLAFGTQCDDNNPCTFHDVCDFSGNCHPGFANTCDDADPCTLDTCDPATGACSHAPNPCDDGVACTTDACDPATGCVHTPDDTACDDAMPCTADLCSPTDPAANPNGCVHDTTLAFGTQCDDGNPCTFPDVCDFSGNCHPGFAVSGCTP